MRTIACSIIACLSVAATTAFAASGTWANVAPNAPSLAFTSGSADIAVTGTAPAVGEVLRVNTTTGNFANGNAYYVVSVVGSTIQLSTTVGGAAQAATTTASSSANVFQNWNNSANWTGGNLPNGIDNVATLSALPGGVRIFMGGDITVGGINFTGGGGSDLDLFGYDGVAPTGGSLTFAVTSGMPTYSFARNNTLPGNLVNARNLAIAGNQGLELIGNSDTANAFRPNTGIDWSGFSGGLVVREGRVDTIAGNVVPNNNDLTVGNASTTAGRAPTFVMSVAGRSQTIGALNGTAAGRIQGGSGNNTLTIGNNGASGTFAGVIGQNANNAQSAGDANLSIAKTGAGTQTFSGANIYTGTTTVNGGTLLVNGTHDVFGTGTAGQKQGGYNVNSGGTLGGTGTIKPASQLGGTVAITVNSGGILAPGASIGTLTLDGADSTDSLLGLNTGATLTFELGAANTSDTLKIVNAQASDIFFNSTVINFNDTTGGGLSGPYLLFDLDADNGYSGLTTDVDGAILAGLSKGTGLESYGALASLFVQGQDIYLQIIPEPSTYALIGMGLLVVLNSARRRPIR